MIIGYARVSTDGQTLDAQRIVLAAAGTEKVYAEKVYAEKVSGAVTDRRPNTSARSCPCGSFSGYIMSAPIRRVRPDCCVLEDWNFLRCGEVNGSHYVASHGVSFR